MGKSILEGIEALLKAAPKAAAKAEAARAARGKEMFPVEAYHGTRADFPAFEQGDFGHHFGTSEQANKRLADTRVAGSDGEQIMPVRLNIRNPLTMDDMSSWRLPEDIADQLLKKKSHIFSEDQLNVLRDIRQNQSADEADLTQISTIIKDAGFDGIKYKNNFEARKNAANPHSYIALEPSQVRSRHAQFDPAKRDSSDLLAGIGAGALALPALNEVVEPEHFGDGGLLKRGMGAVAKAAKRAPRAAKAPPDNLMTGYAGSGVPHPDVIDDGGTFGGVFGSHNYGVAQSHGDHIAEFSSPKHLSHDDYRSLSLYDQKGYRRTNKFLQKEYGITKSEADELAEYVAGDKSVLNDAPSMGIDRLQSILGESDLGDMDWALQRIKGSVAKQFGHTSVGMPDEHGESILFLPGSKRIAGIGAGALALPALNAPAEDGYADGGVAHFDKGGLLKLGTKAAQRAAAAAKAAQAAAPKDLSRAAILKGAGAPSDIDEMLGAMDKTSPGLIDKWKNAVKFTKETGDEHAFFTGDRAVWQGDPDGMPDAYTDAMKQRFMPPVGGNGMAFDMHTHPTNTALPSLGDFRVDNALIASTRDHPFPFMSGIQATDRAAASRRLNVSDPSKAPVADRKRMYDIINDALANDPDLFNRIPASDILNEGRKYAPPDVISAFQKTLSENMLSPILTERAFARNGRGLNFMEFGPKTPLVQVQLNGKTSPLTAPGSSVDALRELDRFVKDKTGYASGGLARYAVGGHMPPEAWTEDEAADAIRDMPLVPRSRRYMPSVGDTAPSRWEPVKKRSMADIAGDAINSGIDWVRDVGPHIPRALMTMVGQHYVDQTRGMMNEPLKTMSENVRDATATVLPVNSGYKVADGEMPGLGDVGQDLMNLTGLTAGRQLLTGIAKQAARMTPAAVAAGAVAAPSDAEAGPMKDAINAVRRIRGYHASPHSFDRFDLSKVGTGEGAQAYGHGLYFAESPAVSGRGGQYDKAFTNDLRLPVERALKRYNGDPDATLAAARAEIERLNSLPNQGNDPKRFASLMDTQQRVVSGIDVLKRTGELPKAKIYEVNINAAPEQMLDWDKPLAQQPHIVEAIPRSYKNFVRETDNSIDETLSGPKRFPFTGGNLHTALANSGPHLGLSYDFNLSNALRDAGIPGIRYLDQGSRGAGEGTSNYVVFDDKLIDILRKYENGGAVEPEHFDKGGLAKRSMAKIAEAAAKAAKAAKAANEAEVAVKPMARGAALEPRKTIEELQDIVRNTPESSLHNQLARGLISKKSTGTVTPPYATRVMHPDEMERLRQKLIVTPDARYMEAPTADIAQLHGGTLMGLPQDRTGIGNLHAVDGKALSRPIHLGGGAMYPTGQGNGAGASGQGVVTTMADQMKKASSDGPVFTVHTPMAGGSSDSARMTSDTFFDLLDRGAISKKDAKIFDNRLRSTIENGKTLYDDFPGLNSENFEEWMKVGGHRRAFMKIADQDGMAEMGLPSLSAIRHAIQDPLQRGLPSATGANNYEVYGGQMISRLDPRNIQTPTKNLPIPHETYPIDIAHAGVMGGLETPVPRSVLFRDFYKQRRLEGKPQGSDERAFNLPPPQLQRVDQQIVDQVSKYIEDQRKLGDVRPLLRQYADGGKAEAAPTDTLSRIEEMLGAAPTNANELATRTSARTAGASGDHARGTVREIRRTGAPLGSNDVTNAASGSAGYNLGPVRLDANLAGSSTRGDGYSLQTISPGASVTLGPISGSVSRDVSRSRFGDEGARSNATRYGAGIDVPIGSGNLNLSHDVTPSQGRTSTMLSGGIPMGAGNLDLYGQLDRERGQKPSGAAGAMFRMPFADGGTVLSRIEAMLA